MIGILRKIYYKLLAPHRSKPNQWADRIEVKSSTIMRLPMPYRFDIEPEKRIYVKIGEKCFLTANFIFESEKGYIEIGNNVQMNGVTLISRNKIIIENDVTMAWGITIYDHNSHSIDWEHRKKDNEQTFNDYTKFGNTVLNKDWTHVFDSPIHIKSKVWIGMNTIILKGVTIGEGAVVGAGSVVTKDVPSWTVVAGNPARIVKQIQHQ